MYVVLSGRNTRIFIPGILNPPILATQWRIQDFQEAAPIPHFGAKTYYLSRFSPKLHENVRNWTDSAPLGSANATPHIFFENCLSHTKNREYVHHYIDISML